MPRPRAGFVRNVAVLAGGTALGQLLTIAASPVLTRLYDPADFGVLGVYAALLTTITTVASLRYELAIPVSDDEEAAASLLVLCLVAVIGTAALTWLLVQLAEGWLATWPNGPALGRYIWLLPLGVIGAGFYKAATYWAFRRSLFTQVARTRVQQRIGQLIAQVILGIMTKGPLGLIVGQIVGQSGGSISLFAIAWRLEAGRLRRVTARSVRAAAVRYIRFPLFSSWAGALNTMSVQIPTIILAASFGAATAGLYTLGYQVLQVPMRFVGEAIGQVFFSSAAKARQTGRVAEITLEVFSRLVEIGIPAVLVVATVLPDLFSLAFGQEWRLAGLYSMWLAPWLTLVFIASPLSTLTSVLERQRNELFFQVALVATRLIGLAIGIASDDATIAIALYGFASAACWLWYMFWALRISGNSGWKGVVVMWREAIGAVPYVLPLLVIAHLVDDSLVVLWTAAVIGFALAVRTLSKWRETLIVR